MGALRGRAAPGRPSLRSPPPAQAPRLSGTSFACRRGSRVCARGGRRGLCVGRGGGEGALPLGSARARATAPPLGADAGSPAPSPSGPRPRGTKGRAGSSRRVTFVPARPALSSGK